MNCYRKMSTIVDALITPEVRLFAESVATKLGITQVNLDVTQGCRKSGTNFGYIAKVKVEDATKTEKGPIMNWMIKSALRKETYRSYVPIAQLYEREAYIYSTVLPAFESLQQEKGVPNPFNCYPKFYGSYLIPKNEAIIMEDMEEKDYLLHHQRKPLDYDHVMMVMHQYGRLHALSFALSDQKPKKFNEIYRNTPEVLMNNLQIPNDYLYKSIQAFSDRALESLDPIQDKVAYNKFKSFQKTMISLNKMFTQSGAAGSYAVISHGDNWINNFLFKYDSSDNIVENVCFLDWQLSHSCSPALDIAYFMFTCTDKSLREVYWDRFLHEYYSSLTTFLDRLGSNPQKLFPYAILEDHLQKYSLHGLYMSMIVLYKMFSDTRQIPDVTRFSNLEAAIEEHNYEAKYIEEYRERIRGVINDFIRLKYEF